MRHSDSEWLAVAVAIVAFLVGHAGASAKGDGSGGGVGIC